MVGLISNQDVAQYIQDPAVNSLGKINVDKAIKNKAGESLRKIGVGNDKAINYFLDLISNQDVDRDIKDTAVYSLGEIGVGNENAINALVDLIGNQDVDKNTKYHAVKSLGIILKDEPMSRVVTDLKAYLSVETSNNNSNLVKKCYGIIWKCAQNMTYPEFHQAWLKKHKAEFSEINR